MGSAPVAEALGDERAMSVTTSSPLAAPITISVAPTETTILSVTRENLRGAKRICVQVANLDGSQTFVGTVYRKKSGMSLWATSTIADFQFITAGTSVMADLDVELPDGGLAVRAWVDGVDIVVNVSGGGGSGGNGSPVDGGYLTTVAGSTGSTNEIVLTAGSNISLTPGAGISTVAVTGTVPSATAATTATALAADPSDCSAGQYATNIAASGNLTCAQVAFTQVSGTLAQSQGGTGSGALTCGAGDFLTSNGTVYSCATPSGGGGGAPTTATYITQTADATLSNEQALSSLSTGLVKVTTGTGVLSTAVASTDYGPPTTALATGILKNTTTTTGAHTIAVAGTDYVGPTSGAAVLLGNGAGQTANYASVTLGTSLLTGAVSIVIYRPVAMNGVTLVNTVSTLQSLQNRVWNGTCFWPTYFATATTIQLQANLVIR